MKMIDHLKLKNAERWQQMKIDPDCSPLLNRVAERVIDNKQRYLTVEEATTVPWFIVAVIHQREASGSWEANLAQGDPWNQVSKHVPRGQGPFNSWEAAAENALKRTPPFAAQWKDWGPGGALTLLELYNGLGYANRELPSPYVWASTNQYHKGKYVADGHFDPNAVDHQLGCAALIAAMALIDHSVKFQ